MTHSQHITNSLDAERVWRHWRELPVPRVATWEATTEVCAFVFDLVSAGVEFIPAPHESPPAKPARKPRKDMRAAPPHGPYTPAEAARKLRFSLKTLAGHVRSGALRYVQIGHGRKRRRMMFTDADIDEFIANQTRKDVPCPSTRTETVVRRISTSTSKCEVIGFTARRNAQRGVKPKR
jgi:hypothetical protein